MSNRNLLITIFFFGIFSSNCNNEPIEIPHELDGIYEGSADWQITYPWVAMRTYSEQIKLEITYPNFKKTIIDKEEGCDGTVTLDLNDLKFDEAIVAYETAFEKDPNNPELMFTYAYIMAAIGLHKKADEMMEDAILEGIDPKELFDGVEDSVAS